MGEKEEVCSAAFSAVDGIWCHCFFEEQEGSTAAKQGRVTTVREFGEGGQKKSSQLESTAEQNYWCGQKSKDLFKVGC